MQWKTAMSNKAMELRAKTKWKKQQFILYYITTLATTTKCNIQENTNAVTTTRCNIKENTNAATITNCNINKNTNFIPSKCIVKTKLKQKSIFYMNKNSSLYIYKNNTPLHIQKQHPST